MCIATLHVGQVVHTAQKFGFREMAVSVVRQEQDTTSLAYCLQETNLDFGELLVLGPGQTLPLGPNSKTDEIGLVLSGLCWPQWQIAPGRRRILELYCPDDVIHFSAFPPLPDIRLFSVDKTEILKVRPEGLSAALQKCDIATRIFEFVSRHQTRKAALVSILGGLQAEARVAALLIELSLRLKPDAGDMRPSYQIPLTRQDIADHLSLNADTLSRIFSRLKSDGVIQRLGRDKIIITDWKALLDLCPIADALLADR